MVCKTFFPAVADNSGIFSISCFSFIKGIPKAVLLSVRVSSAKFSKGSIMRGIIVRFRQKKKRFCGLESRFQTTSVALCDSSFNPIARRILGPVDISLKTGGFHKFVLLSKRVV